MAGLPAADESLLVRTYFGDEVAWHRTVEAASTENRDGFRADVTVVDDEAFGGVGWEELREAARRTGHHAAVLFVADREAMG